MPIASVVSDLAAGIVAYTVEIRDRTATTWRGTQPQFPTSREAQLHAAELLRSNYVLSTRVVPVVERG